MRLSPGDPRTATTTNDNASAGQIGEMLESTVLAGSAVSLVSATAKTVTSITLTPGDWDVWGNVWLILNVATTITNVQAAIHTTTDAIPTAPNAGAAASIAATLTTGGTQGLSAGARRISVAVNTPVYLVAQAAFAINTCAAYGYLGARRAR